MIPKKASIDLNVFQMLRAADGPAAAAAAGDGRALHRGADAAVGRRVPGHTRQRILPAHRGT